MKQCEKLGIPFLPNLPENSKITMEKDYGLIVDAIFGFSFSGKPLMYQYLNVQHCTVNMSSRSVIKNNFTAIVNPSVKVKTNGNILS